MHILVRIHLTIVLRALEVSLFLFLMGTMQQGVKTLLGEEALAKRFALLDRIVLMELNMIVQKEGNSNLGARYFFHFFCELLLDYIIKLLFEDRPNIFLFLDDCWVKLHGLNFFLISLDYGSKLR